MNFWKKRREYQTARTLRETGGRECEKVGKSNAKLKMENPRAGSFGENIPKIIEKIDFG